MVGWVSASGFVKLLVSADKLELRVGFLGRYAFRPEQVVSVTRVSWMLYRGIRIEHCIPSYPRQIIFWYRANPEALLKRIRESGFEPRAPASAIPIRSGLAIRWQAILIGFAVWTSLPFIAERLQAFTATAWILLMLNPALLFFFSFWTPRSAALQRMIVSEGRNPGEIKPLLNLFALLSGIGLLVAGIVIIFQTTVK